MAKKEGKRRGYDNVVARYSRMMRNGLDVDLYIKTGKIVYKKEA